MICPKCNKGELYHSHSFCWTCFDERPMCVTLGTNGGPVLEGSSIQDLCTKVKQYLVQVPNFPGGIIYLGDRNDMKETLGRMNARGEAYRSAWERWC